MRVRIIGLGSNWWSAHSSDVADPLCFRRNVAWFNSAGLKYGNRLRLCWAYPGQVRFNSTSGFNPEFAQRCMGKIVECSGPTRMHGRMHLLASRFLDSSVEPEAHLVSLTERLCGPIRFNGPHWNGGGVQLISVSLRGNRYEVMALMRKGSWIESAIGRWSLSLDQRRLELLGGKREI